MRPIRDETRKDVVRFERRRCKGIREPRICLFPRTRSAPSLSHDAIKAPRSSGSCCPSASIVTTAEHLGSLNAARIPDFRAAPLPRFTSCRQTIVPLSAAIACVVSVLPSSTTRMASAGVHRVSRERRSGRVSAAFNAGTTIRMAAGRLFTRSRVPAGTAASKHRTLSRPASSQEHRGPVQDVHRKRCRQQRQRQFLPGADRQGGQGSNR